MISDIHENRNDGTHPPTSLSGIVLTLKADFLDQRLYCYHENIMLKTWYNIAVPIEWGIKHRVLKCAYGLKQKFR